MRYNFIVPEWQGLTAFILACGPSLKGFNARYLQQYGKVIAINDSFWLCPTADVLYFCDAAWWHSRKHSVKENFLGRRIVTMENQFDGMEVLRNTGIDGLETDPGGLRTGNNSGYAAINLAYHFGCTRIVLLGYDMKVTGEQMHWNHRPERQTPEAFQRTLTDKMLPHFASLKKPLQQAGVEVVNCTLGSALHVWPKCSLESVIRAVDNQQAISA
jgi:hypothetical protein